MNKEKGTVLKHPYITRFQATGRISTQKKKFWYCNNQLQSYREKNSSSYECWGCLGITQERLLSQLFTIENLLINRKPEGITKDLWHSSKGWKAELPSQGRLFRGVIIRGQLSKIHHHPACPRNPASFQPNQMAENRRKRPKRQWEAVVPERDQVQLLKSPFSHGSPTHEAVNLQKACAMSRGENVTVVRWDFILVSLCPLQKFTEKEMQLVLPPQIPTGQ